jgi:hypothetical protein
MERVVLRKVETHFEPSRYQLVIYYHKSLSIRDIYNKVIKKEPRLSDFKPEKDDRDECAVITHDDGVSYLLINSKTPIGILQHEIIHITTALFDYIDATHTEATDEHYAYQTQCIFEFVLQTLLYKFEVPIKNLLTFN